MAVKSRSVWCCTECGHKQWRWAGQCPQCQQWNTLNEEMEIPQSPKGRFSPSAATEAPKPIKLTEVTERKAPRTHTGIEEFDRLLGGGLVEGSLTLIGGDPGIGKSTLMLQVSDALATTGKVVLYVCGEESVDQTSLRARRLGIHRDNLFLLSETNVDRIKLHVEKLKPDLVIVDSIQIVFKEEIASAPGSVSQVRECAMDFMRLAKGTGVAILLIGHVTKAGELAGPRVLEHLVDTVLYFEGDKQHLFRLLRAVKNRFGPTDEIAVFHMKQEGLVEVPNPSEMFLEERLKEVVGSCVVPTVEGSRPILMEVQALVTDTAYSTPSRRCSGIDPNRLALLLAVLEKRMGYQLHQCDVFVATTGGMRIVEPALDLGIVLAVTSSLWNRVVDPHTVAMGEVGLNGEVRSVARVENRVKEAIHMGFKRALVPKRCVDGVSESLRREIHVKGVEMVEEAINAVVI